MIFGKYSCLLIHLSLLGANGWTVQKPAVHIGLRIDDTSREGAISLNATPKNRDDLDSRLFSSTRRDFMKESIFTSSALITGSIFHTQPALAAEKFDKVYKVAPNSLNGKNIVITGATTGLGLESAKRLAAGGATVVLTSRNAEKAQKAVNEVKEYLTATATNNDNVFSAVLDLDDLKSVKSFPERLPKAISSNKIDVLMNNAGVMAVPKLETTKDGYERTFQSNHLGHFALTAKLYSDALLASDARIINVSSEAYNFASVTKTNKQGLDLENLNGEIGYDGWKAYGTSKLANIMFTQELQRRLDEKNSGMTVYTLHPGAVNTDLARNFIGEEKYFAAKEKGPQTFVEKIVGGAVKAALKSVEEGASTQIYLADSVGNKNSIQQKGEFYVDYKPEKLPGWAKDEEKAKELWERSEKLSGVSFKL